MTFPLSDQPTWKIKDSSKLDGFISCNRKHFYEHVLGWRLDQPAHDLYFGECYHRAREHQLIHGYEDVPGAFSAFETHYRKEFPPDTDELYRPKTPAGALRALLQFYDERSRDLEENEVVILDGVKMTEISGSVPIDKDRVIYYRMDSIMRRKEDGMIFSWDHKTTHEKYLNSRMWSEAFHLSLQNGTYTHCLYCMFPIEEVLGIEFCGTGFAYLSKGSNNRPAGHHVSFKRVPAFKDPEQMNVWLWNINDLFDNMDREMDRLFDCDEGDQVLMAFPMNPKNCTSFRGCPYHDFCLSWPNPLQRCYEPPIGFREEFWNPSEMNTTNKRNLEWK